MVKSNPSSDTRDSLLGRSSEQQRNYNAIHNNNTSSSDDDEQQQQQQHGPSGISYQTGDGRESSTATLQNLSTEDKIGTLSLTLLTICLSIGAALPSLDISIVYTTMTQIGSEFQSAQLSTWIHSSYTLCSLITMASVGGLSNAFGRKPVLLILNILFLIGSTGCGYAQSFNQIVIARLIAGIGGGGLTLLGNIILHDVVSTEKVGTYLSYLSTVQTLGFGLGAPIGGFINDYLGWRYCFRINIIPLILILYVYVFHLNNYSTDHTTTNNNNNKVKTTTKEKLEKVDIGGILLVSIGNVCFTCTLLLGGNAFDWLSPQIIIALIVAPIAYISFFIYEHRWAKHPLLSSAASKDRNFIISCICVFLLGMAESGALAMIPQFLMGVLGYNTSDAGLWIMVEAMMCPVGCFIAGRYLQYTGRFARFITVNIALYVLSTMILYCWTGNIISNSIGAVGIILEGLSYGCFIVPLIVACTSTLSKEVVATAMSMCLLVRSVGYLTGTALVTAVIQSTLKTLLPQRIEGEDAEKLIEFIITSIRKVNTLSPEIQKIVADILSIGMQRATLLLMTVSTLAFLCSLRFRNISLKNDNN
ncbi:major facilitator superfamily domain-containing protein [Phascolomyces articulosus]|uniref:Major facilitator superfamily domain-containing protein n=1 Tax=Phascolomyces articulosus TaxID=60185 RepID=A0AAD5PEA6_9FUNG|nr:major facilitator superfamily domain-containing protein [Phascolomyces articulosus]